MKAISTRFIGPTNMRGARIKADDGDGNSITIGYPHASRMGSDAHAVAALALAKKMGWQGDLVSGGTGTGWAFIFVDSAGTDRYTTDEDAERAYAATKALLDAIA